jgi:hypothetical protein
MVTMSFTVKDLGPGSAIPGVQVDVCGPYDVDCTTHLDEKVTSDAGLVTLSFPNVVSSTSQYGLNGHLQLTGAGIAPSLFYWGFPLAEAEATLYDNFVTPAEFQTDLAATHVTPAAMHGFLAAAVYDCLGYPSPGAKVTLSPEPDSPLQTFDTLLTPASVTGKDGILIFDNVPVGSVTLTAFPAGLGGRPSSQVNATVRDGMVTELVMFPTPLGP